MGAVDKPNIGKSGNTMNQPSSEGEQNSFMPGASKYSNGGRQRSKIGNQSGMTNTGTGGGKQSFLKENYRTGLKRGKK